MKKYIILGGLLLTLGTALNVPHANANKLEAQQIAKTVETHFTKGQPDVSFVTRKVSISGDYALASWTWGDTGGQALLKKKDDKWTIVTAGGGQLGEKGLIQYGVPKNIASALTKGQK
jgi:hypothetical protein